MNDKNIETDPNQDQIDVEGVVEPNQNKCGQLINLNYNGKLKTTDPYIPRELLHRFKIKRGSFVCAKATHHSRHSNAKVCFINTIEGLSIDERKKRLDFSSLTTITPNQQIKLETRDGAMTTRVIDLFCPIGKGQRGLIVAPPRTGKTTLLHDMARGIKENHPECHLMVLLVDERPEEVTDFRRSIDAEIYASSNDETLDNHLLIADMAIERAKRLVEVGKDVVLFVDSLTRLSRAHNASRGTGRTMTGGLDVRALEKPRQLFSTARNTEESGSLTILATALIETGSRMDDLIFQEFKGTGNMEVVLDRKIAELRLWPAINIAASGTRREELLLHPSTLEKINFFRRALAQYKPIEAAEIVIDRLSKTKSNKEFLNLLRG